MISLNKIIGAFLLDFLIIIFSIVLSAFLVLNFDVNLDYILNKKFFLTSILAVQLLIFWLIGLYRSIWEYSGISDLIKFFVASCLSGLIIVLVFNSPFENQKMFDSIMVVDSLLLFILLSFSRFAYKFWKEHFLARINKNDLTSIFILGSGIAASSLSKELARSPTWKLDGFFDDDPTKHGRTINGVKVIGPLNSLPYWSRELNVNHAIIAMPSAPISLRNTLIKICNDNAIKVFSMPSLDNLLRGNDYISNLTQIDLDNLLGRKPIKLNSEKLFSFLENKIILVTGAGGSIGSELCRQALLFNPKLLLMIEINEFALYKLEQELEEGGIKTPYKFLLGDVRDESRMNELFANYKPEIVFHAAAYKHVPLLELENSLQAIKNNTIGTWKVASIAQQHNVEKFVLISTDKAVNPTNVMGASKRLAEKVCQGLQKPNSTDFVVVRFGNVLGSTGSVIPKFREQIAKGGPITVTHPEITRYFMSIIEAAQLVLEAGMMGKKAEIFVLDMGKPIKIIELANNLIKLSGLNTNDIKIVFTGLRPGEKLYEELLTDKELTLPTSNKKLRVAKAEFVDKEWLMQLIVWLNSLDDKDEINLRLNLSKWVPEYQPYLN
jgi:FlaA1/EpsC-like NDP-sugar epimerase